MSGSTYERLQELTSQIDELADAPAPSVARIQSLKRELGESLAGDLLTAVTLQSKAREKLGSGTWWVTDKSLQQATPWQVARVKSQWFGDAIVHDLCCGIGGDTIGLASRGPVIGVDRDQQLIQMAQANLAGQSNASFRCGDVTDSMSSGSVFHIDPDRRSEGQRVSRPEASSPPWLDVIQLASAAAGALIKLAPAANPDLTGLHSFHRVWISLAGSVREQSILTGHVRNIFVDKKAETEFGRSALVASREARATLFQPAVPPDQPSSITDQPDALIVDPDAAIRAAGLTDAFANQFGLSTLGGPSGFLTGASSDSIPAALAIARPLLWFGSFDDRRLRRELRSRNMFPDRIKTRGVDVDPAKLQKRLRDCGDQAVTLWIGRCGIRRFAAITNQDADARS